MPMVPETMVVLGTIGAPHGVKGAVHINTALEEPLSLKDYNPLLLEDGRALHVLETKAQKGQQIVAIFEEVSDRDEAKALTHQTLSVPRDRLPEPDEGDYYHVDLIGLHAIALSGASLGEVKSVHNFGAGDILEIGTDKNTLMVAFTDAFVPQIDFKAGKIFVSDDVLQNNEEDEDEGA
ncbi:MAG: ribosome maturation factor RimM [Pseudomonadota bacterium]